MNMMMIDRDDKITLRPVPLILDCIPELVEASHSAAVDCGWYTDITTGKPLQRNTGELLMLTVSELTEAALGYYMACNDDKLPKRSMFEVELADTLIRIFDMAGHFKLDLNGALFALSQLSAEQDAEFRGYIQIVRKASSTWMIEFALLRCIIFVGRAMEWHRKSQMSKLVPHLSGFEVELANVIRALAYLASVMDFDLRGAIDEKIEFNRTRPDHMLAARRLPGGKKY